MSNLRRVMMVVRQGGEDDNVVLPQEYQKVAYLESSGTQRISTNRQIGILDTFELAVSWVRQLDSYQSYFWGGYRMSSINIALRCGYQKTGTVSFLAFSTNGKATEILYDGDYITTRKVKVSPTEGLFVDGVKVVDAWGVNCRENFCPEINLFWYNSLYAKFVRIHSFKWLDADGNKIMHMAPCYRKEDGKPGMYDVVSETFFTNAGTGEFIVGEDVNG